MILFQSFSKNSKIITYVLLILFASFFQGGNHQSILFIFLSLLSLFVLILEPTSDEKERIKLLKNSILLMIGYQLFQILPLPYLFINFLSPSTIELYHLLDFKRSWYSIALNYFHLLKYLATWIFIYIVFTTIPFLISRKKDLEILINTILLIGLIHTLWGLFVLLFDISQFGPYSKIFYLNSNTGFFINRNNFSLFLILMFHLSLYQLSFYYKKEIQKNKNNFYQTFFSNFLILRLVMVFFVIGIILTKSRIGNFSFGLSLISYLFLDLYYKKKFTFVSKTIIFILLLDIIFLSQYFSFNNVIERYIETSFSFEKIRFDVFTFSFKQFLEFPILGYGLGNFENIFRIFYGPYEYFYDHVHNDYLEYLGELGIVGIIILIFVIYAYIKTLKLNYLKKKISYEKISLLLSVTLSVIVHIAFDFSLHIPANLILLTLIYSIVLVRSKN